MVNEYSLSIISVDLELFEALTPPPILSHKPSSSNAGPSNACYRMLPILGLSEGGQQ
jgi:hypothetical protein